MALAAIDKELKNILRGIDYHTELYNQSRTYITELYYTDTWGARVVANSVIRILRYGNKASTRSQGGVFSREDVKGAIETIRNSAMFAWKYWNTEDHFANAAMGNFNIYTRPYSQPLPTTPDLGELGKNPIAIDTRGSSTRITFYFSYDQSIKDLQGRPRNQWDDAVRSIWNNAISDCLDDLKSKLGKADIERARGGQIVRDPSDGTVRRNDDAINASWIGAKTHGIAEKSTAASDIGGAGYKEDTTVGTVSFIEKLEAGKSHILTEATAASNANDAAAVLKDVAVALNAAYKITGYDFVNGFTSNRPGVSKGITISIVFGPAELNSLMKKADLGAGGIPKTVEDIRKALMIKYANDPQKKLSKSFYDMATAVTPAMITHNMKTKSGMPDMRFKVNKKLFGKNARSTKTQKGPFRGGVTKLTKTKVKNRGKRAAKTPKEERLRGGVAKTGGQARTPMNPLALRELLNKALPKTIASKMTYPALRYRTGRFAESAEVLNVLAGKRGGLQIDYAYRKNPYQTFEPGFAQGSTMRDPRKIIGESVREIAMALMGARFLRIRRV